MAFIYVVHSEIKCYNNKDTHVIDNSIEITFDLDLDNCWERCNI